MFTKWLTGNSFKAAAVVVIGAIAVRIERLLAAAERGSEEVLPEIAPPQISKKPEYEVTTDDAGDEEDGNRQNDFHAGRNALFTLDGKRLKDLNVKIGQKVTAGQVIGPLDVDDMRKQLRSDKLNFSKDETANEGYAAQEGRDGSHRIRTGEDRLRGEAPSAGRCRDRDCQGYSDRAVYRHGCLA